MTIPNSISADDGRVSGARLLVSMPIIPLLIGVAASGSTLLGGLLALRLAGRVHLLLGLTAGIVLGVALFDLIPEALETGAPRYGPRTILLGIATGTLLYMLFDRLLASARDGRRRWRTHLGPASLTLHSLLDGVGIGLAFQVSPEIGWVVAAAVLTHDMADGINTVTLCLAEDGSGPARRWLIVNGLAPLLGVIIGQLLHVPPAMLAPLLALFAGVFLYIGACELIPRSYALSPTFRTSLASIIGIVLMYLVTTLARA